MTEVPAEKVVLEVEKVVLEAVTAVKEVSAEPAEEVVLAEVPDSEALGSVVALALGEGQAYP